MLQAIRERAQGWIAWVIVILISIPFALWGVQEYLGVGAEPVVASVDGEEITERELDRRFQQFRMELRERLGSAYQPELFDDAKLREEVLQDMVRSNLILQSSLAMGLRAGDSQVRAAILAVPAFQRDGRFAKDAYERALSLQGMSPTQFEQRVRGSLLSSQMTQVVTSSEFVTDKEIADAVRLRNQQRLFSYFLVPAENFEYQEDIAQADIQAYYQDNTSAFQSPEQVQLEYLVLDQQTLAEGQAVDEEALKALYQSRIESYKTPEQRRARHILVAVSADADAAAEDEARRKIDAIRTRIADGEDFALVAKEVSEDPGSADQGGDLGFFERGIMDSAFENTTFSLDVGVLSEPVRSAFGYHLIEVSGIEAETVKPFDEVREQLVSLASKDEAERQYFELADQMGNLTYESPDSLVPAAEALSLQVQSSDWIGRSGGEGILSQAKVIGAAFSDDVLLQGNNSEVIEVDDEGRQKAVVVRVLEHQEASLKPLDEVSAEISEVLRREKTQAAVKAEAAALAERLQAGESLEQVAGAYAIVDPEWVQRTDGQVPSEVVGKAFSLSLAQRASSIGIAEQRDGSSAIIVLKEIKDGAAETLAEHEKETEQRLLSRGFARSYYDELVNDLQSRADIRILTKTERE
jgi:peptidyl-prolyl cis-trans isomerase D